MLNGDSIHLGREEKIVLNLLQDYGPLQEEQIIQYFPYLNRETVMRLLERMSYRRFIYRCGESNSEALPAISARATDKDAPVENYDNQAAFWVIDFFIRQGKINGKGHSPARFPSQAMVIVNGKSIFELVVFSQGDERVKSYQVRNYYQTHIEDVGYVDEAEPVKFIAVIFSPNQAENIDIPNLHAYAVVDMETGNVRFMSAKKRVGDS